MSVCTTCHERGIKGEHDCPGPQYADILFTRHRGRGITIDTAPARARIELQVLLDRYAYLYMPTADTVVFADQVVYRVTGYADGALELELVEDWRMPGVVTLPARMSGADVEAFKARWLETHGNSAAAYQVDVVAEEAQP